MRQEDFLYGLTLFISSFLLVQCSPSHGKRQTQGVGSKDLTICGISDQELNATALMLGSTLTFGSKDCPPKQALDPKADNLCIPRDITKTGKDCAAFCQLTTEFYYGRELPLINGNCRGPGKCEVRKGTILPLADNDQTVQPEGVHNLGVNFDTSKQNLVWAYQNDTAGLDDAIVPKFNYAVAKDTVTVPLEKGQCGYFTFIPIMKKTNGTLVESSDCNNKAGNAANWKTYSVSGISYRATTGDSRYDGLLIFVNTDCVSWQRYSTDLQEQHPAYWLDGVAINSVYYYYYRQEWSNQQLLEAYDLAPITCNSKGKSSYTPTLIAVGTDWLEVNNTQAVNITDGLAIPDVKGEYFLQMLPDADGVPYIDDYCAMSHVTLKANLMSIVDKCKGSLESDTFGGSRTIYHPTGVSCSLTLVIQ